MCKLLIRVITALAIVGATLIAAEANLLRPPIHVVAASLRVLLIAPSSCWHISPNASPNLPVSTEGPLLWAKRQYLSRRRMSATGRTGAFPARVAGSIRRASSDHLKWAESAPLR